MSVLDAARHVYHVRWPTWRRERSLRYLSLPARLSAWVRHRHVHYRLLDDAAARARRTSDTVFVLGSGPSLNRLGPADWARVARDDSFGMNFSYLVDHVPTFHILEDPKRPELRALVRRTLAPRRERLAGAVWVMRDRQLERGLHPRYAPDFFPISPMVWPFHLDGSIHLDEDRPFRTEDFARTVRYRGTLSVTLSLVFALGYRRVVLLGIDLDTIGHFFDGREEMRELVDLHHALYAGATPGRPAPFPLMVPRGSKKRPLDEYLYALAELWCAPRGIALATGFAGTLTPRLPVFEDW